VCNVNKEMHVFEYVCVFVFVQTRMPSMHLRSCTFSTSLR